MTAISNPYKTLQYMVALSQYIY